MHAFIDLPVDRFDAGAAFWLAVTRTRLSARRGARGEFATLLADEGDAHLKVQVVGGAGGIHLDPGTDDPQALVQAALDLGGSVVAVAERFTVLRSPGGLLLCAVPYQGESARTPVVAGPGGALSRVDQVSVDVAPSRYDAETAFWAGLTGWDLAQGSRPEFRVLRPPAHLPLRILLQRLDEEQPTGAHLDLACSDVDAVRAWHESHGATTVARHERWTVMHDPTGSVYCLTSRDPATGTLPAT
ncbi:hypothetical protein Cs7R123_18220 [Catellatospora sp. TT07R-123]|nr:hypothetical protein Cs7R123_18220 [Catellatospora sp. TT07R-123]